MTRPLQPWLILLAACGSLGLLNGCTVTRKSATLDSTSRMPFLNMELAPKLKEPAPETQRIRFDKSSTKVVTKTVEAEPAKLTVNTPAADGKPWWQLWSGTEKRTSIPLPRTDLVAPSPAPQPIVKSPASDASFEF